MVFSKGGYCSGSLNPDSPLSGQLPLEGDCLDEEPTVSFLVSYSAVAGVKRLRQLASCFAILSNKSSISDKRILSLVKIATER